MALGPMSSLFLAGFSCRNLPNWPDPNGSVVLYDMRNRGLSRRVGDAAQITIMGDVADVEALRRHFGADKVSPVGYSYLGLMVAIYATEHPGKC